MQRGLAIAFIISGMIFASSLLVKIEWVSRSGRFSLGLCNGEVWLCDRNKDSFMRPPTPGWTTKLSASAPNLRFRIIGYPGDKWYVVSLTIPLMTVAAVGTVHQLVKHLIVPHKRLDNGQIKCPVCSFNLTGNVSGRCPECGVIVGKGGGETLAREEENGTGMFIEEENGTGTFIGARVIAPSLWTAGRVGGRCVRAPASSVGSTAGGRSDARGAHPPGLVGDSARSTRSPSCRDGPILN